MATSLDEFIRSLTSKHRVVVLGGLAVIAHGFSRSTYDGDIWLDPKVDADTWAKALLDSVEKFEGLTIHRLPHWQEITAHDLSSAISETGIIRIQGLKAPLDIFRKPNEIELDAFDSIYSRGKVVRDGTVLPDPLDLILSKTNTGRDKDFQDIIFLESIVRKDYKNRLPTASFDEARDLLCRYSEWQVLEAALENPDERVQALAREHLQEFADAGDPFSQAILAGREIP